jgi:hypothetical protein
MDLFTKIGLSILIILFILLMVLLFRQEQYKKVDLGKTEISEMMQEMPPSEPKFQFQQDLHPMRYQTLDYAAYQYDKESPKDYHRYQSNLCDPTQDELPITFPDPNADLPPFEYDPLIMQLKYGSMPCDSCNQLNYCQ